MRKVYLLVENAQRCPDLPYRVIEVYTNYKTAFGKLKRGNTTQWVQTWVPERR